MERYLQVKEMLRDHPRTWLVTGCAGFIGSNLLEALLKLDQKVIGLDNLSTGFMRNLREVRFAVSTAQWQRFHFIEGDIRHPDACKRAVEGVEIIAHQAALGSVPRSFSQPAITNDVNINGLLNVLTAARDAGIRNFIYASSSACYGAHQAIPKTEENIGNPLSPYAVTKLVNEMYAGIFATCYELRAIGLRYFNVFGKRQDPDGAYAAVIPRWTAALIRGEQVFINGDGSTSRDFCHVDNVVQANLLAALAPDAAHGQVYNIAVGESTTLNKLYTHLDAALQLQGVRCTRKPVFRDFRTGDVSHSLASIRKAREFLGYEPAIRIREGVDLAVRWYLTRERAGVDHSSVQQKAQLS